jgi:hypothetical protein
MREYLAQPVDGASLAVFRIAFGALMVWEVGRYFQYDWITYYWIAPDFHFTYPGFSWLRPWPGHGMYVHFAVLGASAAAIAAGRFTRVAASVFFLGFTYAFLLDRARYLNHFYLISLLAFLLMIVPAHRVWSLDSAHVRSRGVAWPSTVPMWTVWLLRFQMGVVYAFAGFAKFDQGWLSGHVFTTRFETTGGPIMEWIAVHGFAAIVLAWGGLAFDLLIVPFLLWSRTRPVAFAAAVLFHVSNALLFSIGVFPWLGIAATTIFFSPDWPRALLRPIARRWGVQERAPLSHAGDSVGSPSSRRARGGRRGRSDIRVRPISRPTFALLTAYVVIQLAVPIRHVLYAGEVDWNRRGHRFSWRMKLHSVQGLLQFRVVTDADTTIVFPSNHMPEFQTRTMMRYPGMILQFAQHVSTRFQEKLQRPVRVYADAVISMDGQPASLLIDPRVDLASQRDTFGRQPWILAEGAWPY